MKQYDPKQIEEAIKIVSGGGGRRAIAKKLKVSEAQAREFLAIANYLIANNGQDLIDLEASITRASEVAKIWKKKYNQVIKKLGFQKEVLALVQDALGQIPPPSPVKINLPEQDISEENLTLLLGDFHANEIVSREEMFGINEYNFKIFLERLGRVFGSLINISQNKLKGYKFRRLNIDLLGDLISGSIHEELERTNSPNDIIATIHVASALAQAISAISAYFPEIHIHGVIGNHGRRRKKVSFKESTDNFDYLIYLMLKQLLADHKNIKFDFPASWFLVYESNGHHVGMFHGDGIKSYYGIPYYGLNRAIKDLFKVIAQELNIKVSIWEIGHFHQPTFLPDNAFINGSLVGADEFSIKKLKSASPPCQWMYGTHKSRGITFFYALNPSKPTKHSIELNIPLDSSSGS